MPNSEDPVVFLKTGDGERSLVLDELEVTGAAIFDDNVLIHGNLTVEGSITGGGGGGTTDAFFAATDPSDQFRVNSTAFDLKSTSSASPSFNLLNNAESTQSSRLNLGSALAYGALSSASDVPAAVVGLQMQLSTDSISPSRGTVRTSSAAFGIDLDAQGPSKSIRLMTNDIVRVTIDDTTVTYADNVYYTGNVNSNVTSTTTIDLLAAGNVSLVGGALATFSGATMSVGSVLTTAFVLQANAPPVLSFLGGTLAISAYYQLTATAQNVSIGGSYLTPTVASTSYLYLLASSQAQMSSPIIIIGDIVGTTYSTNSITIAAEYNAGTGGIINIRAEGGTTPTINTKATWIQIGDVGNAAQTTLISIQAQGPTPTINMGIFYPPVGPTTIGNVNIFGPNINIGRYQIATNTIIIGSALSYTSVAGADIEIGRFQAASNTIYIGSNLSYTSVTGAGVHIGDGMALTGTQLVNILSSFLAVPNPATDGITLAGPYIFLGSATLGLPLSVSVLGALFTVISASTTILSPLITIGSGIVTTSISLNTYSVTGADTTSITSTNINLNGTVNFSVPPVFTVTNLYGTNFIPKVKEIVSSSTPYQILITDPYNIVVNGTANQVLTLPNATTWTQAGAVFHFRNESTLPVTLNYFGGTLMESIPSGATITATLLVNATTAGVWSFYFSVPDNSVWSDAALQTPSTITTSASTPSTTVTSGAIVSYGGLGVVGNANIGGYTSTTSLELQNSGTITLTAPTGPTAYTITLPAAGGGTGTFLEWGTPCTWGTPSSTTPTSLITTSPNNATGATNATGAIQANLGGAAIGLDLWVGGTIHNLTAVKTPSLILYNSSAETISLVAPSAIVSYTLTLPTYRGAVAQVLYSDGAGNTSWYGVSGSYGPLGQLGYQPYYGGLIASQYNPTFIDSISLTNESTYQNAVNMNIGVFAMVSQNCAINFFYATSFTGNKWALGKLAGNDNILHFANNGTDVFQLQSGGTYTAGSNSVTSLVIRAPVSGTVTLQPPGYIATNYTLTLPSDSGTAGQALLSNGLGNQLTWGSPSPAYNFTRCLGTGQAFPNSANTVILFPTITTVGTSFLFYTSGTWSNASTGTLALSVSYTNVCDSSGGTGLIGTWITHSTLGNLAQTFDWNSTGGGIDWTTCSATTIFTLATSESFTLNCQNYQSVTTHSVSATLSMYLLPGSVINTIVGTITSIALNTGTANIFTSTGGPITTSGNFTITYAAGQVLPIANGGTNSSTITGSGIVILSNSPIIATPTVNTSLSIQSTSTSSTALITSSGGTLTFSILGTTLMTLSAALNTFYGNTYFYASGVTASSNLTATAVSLTGGQFVTGGYGWTYLNNQTLPISINQPSGSSVTPITTASYYNRVGNTVTVHIQINFIYSSVPFGSQIIISGLSSIKPAFIQTFPCGYTSGTAYLSGASIQPVSIVLDPSGADQNTLLDSSNQPGYFNGAAGNVIINATFNFSVTL